MLFGNKQEFALECELDRRENDPPQHIFGCIALWAGGSIIGDFSVVVLLNASYEDFKRSLEKCGKRKDSTLINMTCIEAWNFLDTALYGNDNHELSYVELEERFGESRVGEKFSEELDKEMAFLDELSEKYDKFNICINFSEAFDGEAAFLIEEEHEERLIWQDFESKSIREIKLKADTYKHVLKSFIAWFEEVKAQQERK